MTGSEDVGVPAAAAGAPTVFWLLGGADLAAFAGATGIDDVRGTMAELPSNHSPAYAPVLDPTLDVGVACLVEAAGHGSSPSDTGGVERGSGRRAVPQADPAAKRRLLAAIGGPSCRSRVP
ncbi:hypothetical protein [Solicola sp. PLA-1-18]|uniref:hypothetical protein n=1 Tax=Solicola sp. PLA-1-18 TaxID=3380532 RepID=UPI003B7CC51B